MAILISDNQFSIKNYRSKGKALYIDKCSIQQDDVVIVNMYMPNYRPPKCIK